MRQNIKESLPSTLPDFFLVLLWKAIATIFLFKELFLSSSFSTLWLSSLMHCSSSSSTTHPPHPLVPLKWRVSILIQRGAQQQPKPATREWTEVDGRCRNGLFTRHSTVKMCVEFISQLSLSSSRTSGGIPTAHKVPLEKLFLLAAIHPPSHLNYSQ